jgi:hypothetical protein
MIWLLLLPFLSLHSVETPEDTRRLAFFHSLHDAPPSHAKIPPTLHFIWLGPKPLSSHHIAEWISLHPGWRFKLWADHPQSNLPPNIECLSDFPLNENTELYFLADNFAERRDLLSYILLANEGGFTIDPHIKPLQSLHTWDHGCDFIAGLEPIAPSIMSSSILVDNHLIGATPHHPILEETLFWLRSRWSSLDKLYPGSDPTSLHNRRMHRTHRALNEGILKQGLTSGYCNQVISPLYSHEVESRNEEPLLKRLDTLTLLLYLLGALNVGALFLFARRQRT